MGAAEAELSQTIWMYRQNKVTSLFIQFLQSQTSQRVTQSSDVHEDEQLSSLIATTQTLCFPSPTGVGRYYVRNKLL